MKYDILNPFQKYLQKNLTANTAKTYYAAVVKLFRDKQFDNLGQIDRGWILQETAAHFHTKSEYSAVKNGLKWLKRFDQNLDLPTEEEFSEISQRKRNRSKKPKKVIYLRPTQRKINQISNDRLRYAYRLALISGLRVSELADLEASDLTFEDNKISVRVRKGKGGHGGIIECRPDPYLQERLPEFIKSYPEGKIFYSESYMIEEANKLGIECHDLRRIFAITTKEELKKEMPAAEANLIVQQRLRHTRFSVTKRYLHNRKLKFEYEKEDKKASKKDESVKKEGEKPEKIQQPGTYTPITRIDKSKLGALGNKVVKDEVILTANRKQHIIDGRGKDFFDKYSASFKSVIDDPDYVLEDKNPNTVLMAKQVFQGDKYITLVIRLAVQGDNPDYYNSIITAIGMGEKKFNQRLNQCNRENKIIYKKG